MEDVGWTASDDAQASIAGMGLEEPFLTALAFMQAVTDPGGPQPELDGLVTPESIPLWEDFAAVRNRLDEIGDWGLGSYPEPAPGAPDVAYVKVLSNVTETYQVRDGDNLVELAAWLTLVWRPEFGYWMIHAFGGLVAADDVPRSSPGEAPNYTRASG